MNVYLGLLVWINLFIWFIKYYFGWVVFFGVNFVIVLIFMEVNMFDFLNIILGCYVNCGMVWVVVVVLDIGFNKYLFGLLLKIFEFCCGMLYVINLVGFGLLLLVVGLLIVIFFGGLGVVL